MRQQRTQLLWGLLFGVLCGFLLQKGGATRYDVIVGQLLLEDFTVLKIMLSAVLTGTIGIHIMKRLGWVDFRPKAGSWGRNALGGLIFGVGFALLGYCPGTIAGAVGNGYLDAAVAGLAGILIGSGLLAALYPRLSGRTFKLGDLGERITFPQLLGVSEWSVIAVLGLVIVVGLYLVERAGL
jgi:uncharacterized protein